MLIASLQIDVLQNVPMLLSQYCVNNVNIHIRFITI